MRTRAFSIAALAWVLACLPASAQNAVTTPSTAWMRPSSTFLPADAGNTLEWGVSDPAQMPLMETYGTLAYVDGRAGIRVHWPGTAVIATCDPVNVAAPTRWCRSMPDALRAALSAPGVHSVQISFTDLATGQEGTKTAVISDVLTPAPCPYTPPSGITEQRTPGSALQGSVPFNKLAGDNYAAARLARLRRDGWRVEWELINPGNPTALWVLGVCVGIPQ